MLFSVIVANTMAGVVVEKRRLGSAYTNAAAETRAKLQRPSGATHITLVVASDSTSEGRHPTVEVRHTALCILARMQARLCSLTASYSQDMKYIELFAGCGGLSLGLRAAGGKMLLANELSPMAAETFAFNLLAEDLLAESSRKGTRKEPLKTKWLNSKFSKDELLSRMRENPQEYRPLEDGKCDLDCDGNNLEGSLIVGSVVHLNAWLREPCNQSALEKLKDGFGTGDIDLVSGGPPCQSFSMAGMRDYTNARNVLPGEFAKFVALAAPRIALLENVTGILRPFEVDGKKIFAYIEVAKAFAQIGMGSGEWGKAKDGYIPLCLHVNAKFAGVAQNRTRFIMLAFRRDVFEELLNRMRKKDRDLLLPSEIFVQRAREGFVMTTHDLRVHDATKDKSAFEGTFLESLTRHPLATVKAAIDDLWSGGPSPSEYVHFLDKIFKKAIEHPDTYSAGSKMENHVLRTHGFDVQRRFRIYQVLRRVPAEAGYAALKILRGKAETLDEKSWEMFRTETFYVRQNMEFEAFSTKQGFENFLLGLRTSKHAQRALVEHEPAPAALSIPDDMCHFLEEPNGLRTLTVREMARIQSFPDNFVFRSKATTGGPERRHQVPQYTQVGNAVPPLLGHALGEIVKGLLRMLDESSSPSSNEEFQEAA
jgi:DNA (cytosine-5)-methyltransferase 1